MDEIFKYDKTEANEDYYQILGCSENSSKEQIICEYRNRCLTLHPDKQHNNTKEAEDQFKQLVKAKDVLTDPQMRKSYDKWKGSGIAISFDKWKRLGKDIHTSMHWMSKGTKDLMIDSGVQESHLNQQSFECNSDPLKKIWKSDYNDSNELLRKFRNYEI